MQRFSLPIRVYYEDTDAGGVVYHARYLHFFERARTDYLRGLGFSQQALLDEHNLAFVVKTMQIDYRLAAKLDDLLTVETEISGIKGATILFSQQIKRNDVLICTAEVKVACVDLTKMKPVAIPQEIKAAFNG
ncbi:tol-pal system-associated acyl-CoA thioesterase [Avibacterium avium]|uniref:tol-pal system-associated acyl-CoA thioesterase n=1 Tax=Avibacterium avium TaxID=751 RepID=UPI003BF79EDB